MMMRRFRLALVVAVLAALLAACGSHTVVTTQTVTAPSVPSVKQPPPTGCPVGKSFMGCSSTGLTKHLMLTPPPKGPKFPDVSIYQGDPDWAAAKSSIAGAVAKLGEGSSIVDSSAAYNVSHLKADGIPFAVYWFVRPDGCSAEGNEIERAAKNVGGVPLIVLDEEVAGLSGYAACLNSYVKAVTGRDADVYRSSGNDYDSSDLGLACWVAAYGPASAPACSGRTRVAWQYTDGRYGFPTYIPGVGTGDVSVDYGLLAALKPKPKPSRHHNWLPNARRAILYHNRLVHARERLAVTQWDGHGCRNPVKRHLCRTLRTHMQLLQARIAFVAHHTGKHLKHKARKPRWAAIHYRAKDGHKTTLGGAYHQFVLRLSTKNHGVVTHW